MLGFCDAHCAHAYCDPSTAMARAAGNSPTGERCAQCGSVFQPPAWTSESRALLVELSRLVPGGPALERALRALDRDSLLALARVVRDLEWERTSLRDKAARLGLRGLH